MAELEALGGAADPLSSRTVEATAEPRDLNEKVDKLITFMSNSAAHRIGSDSFMNDLRKLLEVLNGRRRHVLPCCGADDPISVRQLNRLF
jgi:hypothetical protein